MYLTIDVGNTRVKTAVYEDDTMIDYMVFKKSVIVSQIKKILKKYPVKKGVIASVAKLSNNQVQKLGMLINLMIVSSATKVPFKNLYATPKTLGVDRVALAAAAVKKYPDKNVLVIDAGTCVKFDFITKNKEYLGGAISPGIRLRYKSLNDYTANLPLLETQELDNFIGNNTNNSIHSGVINGIINEIDGIINQYKAKFQDLTVVLTGGDANFLSKQLKNSIFAHPNFVLEGLLTILIYNSV